MGEQQAATAARPQLNVSQALAGGLAALTSAFLLSTTGTTGTIVGAALGSVIVTLGNELYEYYLRRVAELRQLAFQRMVKRARSGERLIPTEPEPLKPEVSEVARKLPWRRIGMLSAALFVAVMVTILTMEVATGRALSSYTGGTSSDTGPRTTIPLPVVSDTRPEPEPTVVPDETASPTESETSPSESPTPTPTESEVAPETPTETELDTTPTTPVTPEEIPTVVEPTVEPSPTVTEAPETPEPEPEPTFEEEQAPPEEEAPPEPEPEPAPEETAAIGVPQ